jgi:nitrite reductase/ring-hydroxylating ferredoxin subunit
MLYRLLADGVVLLHLLFVAFVLLGSLAAMRNLRWACLHLPAAAWGAWIEFSGGACPLTPLENWLRFQGGSAGYSGGFVEHYLLPVLYPAALTRTTQIGMGLLVVVVNGLVYGYAVRRRAGKEGATMEWFKRLLGICSTRPPADPGAWRRVPDGVEIDLQRVPELSTAGGAVRLEEGDVTKRVLVVHGEDGHYHAFVNRCTHMGRRIDPLPGTDRVRCCSVSRSTFDYTGGVVSGAAKAGLQTLTVRLQERWLTIEIPG